MTLAVPRSSLLRPLNESAELYDNPDTPGTTYSFQEQGPSKYSMQSDSAHLTAPMMDTSMFMSTDDEMLDSDSDQRRDEDFDIDIDAEVYSANGGDLEITMTMEEESNTYGIAEAEDDNDDIMLDDEPEYNYGQNVPPISANITASIVTQPDSVSTQSQIALSGQDTSFLQPTASSPPLEPVHSLQEPGPPEQPSNNIDTEQSSAAEDTAALALQPQQTGDERDSNNLDHQQESVESYQAPPHDGSAAEEADDRSQSSTATLTHEITRNAEQFLGDENENEADNDLYPEHEYTQPDLTQTEDSDDFSYWHPVIVQYEQNELVLFAPKMEWSASYEDLPSSYLLQDDVLCGRPLEELFMHLRKVLRTEESEGCEFVMRIELLGLEIAEGSTACKSVCLRRILDLHNQLRQNDGQEIPEPVRVSLYKVPTLTSRLDEIASVVNEGKGFKECLIQLGLRTDDDLKETAVRVTDVADRSEEIAGFDEAQTEGLEAPATEDPEILEDEEADEEQQQQLEEATFTVLTEEDASAESEADHASVAADPEQVGACNSTQEDAEQGVDSNSGAGVTYAEELLEDTASVHPENAVAAAVDEDELLEFEDGHDDQQTTQPDTTVQTQENEKLAEDDADGELLGEEELEPSVDRSEPVNQQPEPAHGDTEDHAQTLASPDANSDQNDIPPNTDDTSNNPSPIPVFTAADEDEGEYDEQQEFEAQDFEEQEYDEEEYPQPYEQDGQQYTETDNEQNAAGEQEGLEDAEGYVEDPYTAEEQQYIESDFQQNDGQQDASDDYYDEDQFIEGELEYLEKEIEEYEVEEYDESHFENAEDESPLEVEVVDPSITDAIDVAYLSPVASSHEEELIDYEDDEEDLNPLNAPVTISTMSPTLKRLRDDSDEDGDGELDVDQATKRARAD